MLAVFKALNIAFGPSDIWLQLQKRDPLEAQHLLVGDSMNPKDNKSNEPVASENDSKQIADTGKHPEIENSVPAEAFSTEIAEPATSKAAATHDEASNSVAEDAGSDALVVNATVVAEPTPVMAGRTATDMFLELLRVFSIPALILAAFVVGIALLGVAQRAGWIQSASGDGDSSAVGTTSEESDVSYICPMMCVPPTGKPGRCPVCAMELVPASASSSSGPSSEIQIDPRSRRVAGIKTVPAKSETLSREVRGVGEISYDESKLKTLSAYIDGRIEELYADYTGIEVKKGDSLAMIYSPELYGAQVEYARTLEFTTKAESTNARISSSNKRLLESSRERLVELGMTEEQITKLEKEKSASRRLALHAPISGTVIEKLAVTGQYIKAGTPIYRLADLRTVWLVLELFPEDAKSIQIGQPVTAMTQSMGDVACEGIVEFVEPTVDPKMRTVGIRVAINNEHGHLKPGEFVKATLTIPLLAKNGEAQETIVVPRNSLLSIGETSLAYVEQKPGEFQLRHVKTGPTVGGQIAILEGISAGENVVSHSTFLLDAQMQLQGNPSLIDPDKAVIDGEPQLTEAELEEIRKAFEPLSEADRALAEAQVICPVTEVRLGTLGMGTPVKLDIEGRTVFICCEGCRDMWVENPDKYFKILDDYLAGKSKLPELTDAEKDEIRKALEPLNKDDRKLAEAQVICPVTEVRLGSMGMGTPVKLEIEGRTVFICCEGCRDMWVENPDKYFKILDDYLAGNSSSVEATPKTSTTPNSGSDELPQMELPKMELPKMELPK